MLLAPRHLAKNAAFVDAQLAETPLRFVNVLDDPEARQLRDRGDALAQIAIATAFQNLPPTPNRIWIAATWPSAEATMAALATAVTRLGPAVVIDLSGTDGVRSADNVLLGGGPAGTSRPLGRRGRLGGRVGSRAP